MQPIIASPNRPFALVATMAPSTMQVRAASLYYSVAGVVKRLGAVHVGGGSFSFKIPARDVHEGVVIEYGFVFLGASGRGDCQDVAAAVQPSRGSFAALATRDDAFNSRLFQIAVGSLMPYIDLTRARSEADVNRQILAACSTHFSHPTPCDLGGRDPVSIHSGPSTMASATQLPRIVSALPSEASVAAMTKACTFKTRIWWWKKPTPNTHRGTLTSTAFTFALPLENENAIKQYSYAAKAITTGFVSSGGTSRVGFAVGFQIGSSGGPTVNFQADLQWFARGLSLAQTVWTPFGLLSEGDSTAYAPTVDKAISNIQGTNPYAQSREWEGVGASQDIGLLPIKTYTQANDEFSGFKTSTWFLPLNAGQLYAFHVALGTQVQAENFAALQTAPSKTPRATSLSDNMRPR